ALYLAALGVDFYPLEALRTGEAAMGLRFWGVIAGRAGVLAVAVALLGLYVARYHARLTDEPRRMLGLLIVLMLMLILNKALVAVVALNPHAAVLPAVMVGAILAIACNQQFALAVGSAFAMIAVLHIRGSVELLLVLLAGLASTVLQLDEIRTRTKLIRAAGVSAAGVFLVVCIIGLAEAVPWSLTIVDALWAAGCAAGVGFVVQGILPLIERVFHVATSLTLLEWCDASRPLLKRLAMEAPGTYNHSLQLGAMCEAAAEATNAGGLLARVGAYYHDIGKINKSDYFIENQDGTASRHAKLSPAMSLLIIVGHVKDGVEMAREYGLPKVLHEFIATHHGTTLVQYFYQAATEQRKDGTDRAPDETEFRYPGPKPRSKESAILMLADAAESSVRSMSEPTPGRIENQVNAMVTRRLMDGQLDECELTLREVHQIESSLTKSLCSMYHARIAYPTPAGQKPSAAERQANQDNDDGAQDNGGEGAAGETDSASADTSAETDSQKQA
ncbi:MAG: HDIG domain-containing metalloprotein, partial [Phycisphaerae bacterium]